MLHVAIQYQSLKSYSTTFKYHELNHLLTVSGIDITLVNLHYKEMLSIKSINYHQKKVKDFVVQKIET